MPDLGRDDVADLLAGLDGPRPLPAALSARLCAALLDRAGGGGEGAGAGTEQRAVPAPAGGRIEAALLTAAGGLRGDLDAPRALPPDVRQRLEAALLTATAATPRRRARVPSAAAAAAVVLLLATGIVTAVTRDRGPGRDLAVRPAASPSVTGTRPATTGPAPQVPLPSVAAPTTSPTGGSSGSGGAWTGGSAPNAPAPYARRGAPPPYSGEVTYAAAMPAPRPCSSPCPAPSPRPTTSPPPPPDVVLGVVTGDVSDAEVEAGFRAYLAELSAAGGLGGRRVRTVAASPSGPARGTLATVNLAATELTGWSGGPLLEGLAVTESRLRDDVHSVGSVVERQAHLAADAAFPADAPGSTAVVYAGAAGPWSQRVPQAYEAVLRGRGVTVTRVIYDSEAPVLAPADAAFLALSPADTASWLAAAEQAAYGVPVHGVYPLHDESTAGVTPTGAVVLSPYQLPRGSELGALRSRVQRPLSARVLHGWATAKHLAVAVWRSGATTPSATSSALRQMTGYDGRLAPAHEVRPGTRSRTPEALLHAFDSRAFVPDGSFRRDPY